MSVKRNNKSEIRLISNGADYTLETFNGNYRLRKEPFTTNSTPLSECNRIQFRGINYSESGRVSVPISINGETQNVPSFDFKFTKSRADSAVWSTVSIMNGEIRCLIKPNSPRIGFTKYAEFRADGTNLGKIMFGVYAQDNILYFTETGEDWVPIYTMQNTASLHAICMRIQEAKFTVFADNQLVYQASMPAQGYWYPCSTSGNSIFSQGSDTIYGFNVLVFSPFPIYVNSFYDKPFRYTSYSKDDVEYDDNKFCNKNTNINMGNVLVPYETTTALNAYNKSKRFGTLVTSEALREFSSYNFTYNHLGFRSVDVDAEFGLFDDANTSVVQEGQENNVVISEYSLYGTIMQNISNVNKPMRPTLYLANVPVMIVSIPQYYSYTPIRNDISFTYVSGDTEYTRTSSVYTYEKSSKSRQDIIMPRGSYHIPSQYSDILNADATISRINNYISECIDNINNNQSAYTTYVTAKQNLTDTQNILQRADSALTSAYNSLDSKFNTWESYIQNEWSCANNINPNFNQAGQYLNSLANSFNNAGYLRSSLSWSANTETSSIVGTYSRTSRVTTSITIYSSMTFTCGTSNSYEKALYNILSILDGSPSPPFSIGINEIGMGYMQTYSEAIQYAKRFRDNYFNFKSYLDIESSYYETTYLSAISTYNDASIDYDNAYSAYSDAFSEYNSAKDNVSSSSSYYYAMQQCLDNLTSNMDHEDKSSINAAINVASYFDELKNNAIRPYASFNINDKDVINVKLLPMKDNQTPIDEQKQRRVCIDVNGRNIYTRTIACQNIPRLLLTVFENNMFSNISYTPCIGTSSGAGYMTSFDVVPGGNDIVDNRSTYADSSYDHFAKNYGDDDCVSKLVSRKKYSNALTSLYIDNNRSRKIVSYGTTFFTFSNIYKSSDFKLSNNTSEGDVNYAIMQEGAELNFLRDYGSYNRGEILCSCKVGDKVDVYSYTEVTNSTCTLNLDIYVNEVYFTSITNLPLPAHSNKYYIGISAGYTQGATLSCVRVKDLSPSSADPYVYVNDCPIIHSGNMESYSVGIASSQVSDGSFKSSASEGDSNAHTFGMFLSQKIPFIFGQACVQRSQNCNQSLVQIRTFVSIDNNADNYLRSNASNYGVINDKQLVGIWESGDWRSDTWSQYGYNAGTCIAGEFGKSITLVKPYGYVGFRYMYDGMKIRSSKNSFNNESNTYEPVISNWYNNALGGNTLFGLPTIPYSSHYNGIRYIRSYSNGSTANGGNYWYEIQAIDRWGNNVARKKQCVSNGDLTLETTGSFNCVVDGSSSISYVAVGDGLKYIQVDLADIYDLSQIKIWHYWDDGRTFHKKSVQVSADGVTWREIFNSDEDGEQPETSAGLTIDLV